MRYRLECPANRYVFKSRLNCSESTAGSLRQSGNEFQTRKRLTRPKYFHKINTTGANLLRIDKTHRIETTLSVGQLMDVILRQRQQLPQQTTR